VHPRTRRLAYVGLNGRAQVVAILRRCLCIRHPASKTTRGCLNRCYTYTGSNPLIGPEFRQLKTGGGAGGSHKLDG
jgi:hypothetical protein